MTAVSPLIFRPSFFHRIFAILLFVGSWTTGIRGLAILIEYMPKLMSNIQRAKLVGEPRYLFWTCVFMLVVGCLVSGLLLVTSIFAFILIEGTNITVDKIGITVTYELLPRKLATYFGAGHIPWDKIVHLEKKYGIFFVLHSEQPNGNGNNTFSPYLFSPSVKFIIVHELERLIFTILKCSQNITFR